MKKILYTILLSTLIFSACKKEEEEDNNNNTTLSGCTDSIAFNYNANAVEEDNESCDYRVTGGKWVQISESFDVHVTIWGDQNQTQFIDSTNVSEYESNIDSMSIQQLKFFTDGNVKKYDSQSTITDEGTWSEDQEGTLNHTITIIDVIDGEQIIFNVNSISKESMYLSQDLNVFEYEEGDGDGDGAWIQYVGTQYFSLERDEN